MKHKLYCVKDTLLGRHLPPVLGDSDAGMTRSYGDAVLKGDSDLSLHPEDFCLVCIGEFDDSTGALIPYSTPVVVCHASDFVKGN